MSHRTLTVLQCACVNGKQIEGETTSSQQADFCHACLQTNTSLRPCGATGNYRAYQLPARPVSSYSHHATIDKFRPNA